MDKETYYTYSEIEELIINYKSADAIKLLVSLLNSDKEDVEILFEKAMIYYYIDSNLNDCLKQLNFILKSNPDYLDALLLKGEILAGLHKHEEAIETLNIINPKILPYSYKKLIEYITEFNHRSAVYYSVFDFDSYWEYVYIETDMLKKLNERHIDYLEEKVFKNGLIWQYLDIDSYRLVKEKIPIISGSRLSDEEPTIKSLNVENVENCVICGKKLINNQKSLCKSCLRKQYASKIIKKLVLTVQPEVPFKKCDLKSLNLADIQIQDYIWTLQEFNLIDVDNNKFILKDKNTLNNFRIDSKMDPIDFDSIDEKNKLNKTCKICGKTLPISQFYKSSEGYEDTCKVCKKLTVTARYLENIICYVGFDNEFNENDLIEYISNQNQIMGMIWSLQDNDLLIEKESKTYVLADKSKCLDFLDKYDSDYEFQETNIKPKSKVKSKSKVKENLNKSKIDETVAVSVKSKKDLRLVNEKKEQMKIILKARKEGKTRKESADIAEIPYYKINHWYKEGKQGFGKDNVYFYKQLKKIEDNLLDSLVNERKQMNFVLKLLRQGKSKDEIAKLTELDKSTITTWYNQGKEKYSRNTIYFFIEVQKIEEINKNKSKVENLKVQLKEFIPKFIELDDKLVEVNVVSYELSSLRNEIKSNIEILKASSRLRKIDKLENRLLNAEKSYKELNNQVNDELIKNINGDSNKPDLLEFLYSITGSDDISLKVSFIKDLAFNHLSVKDGKNVRNIIEMEIADDILKTSDDVQLRFDELIKEKKTQKRLLEFLYSITNDKEISNIIKKDIDDGVLKTSDDIKLRFELIKEKKTQKRLLEFLYSITNDKEIRYIIKKDIDDGVLKTSDDIQLRFYQLNNQKLLNNVNHLINSSYSQFDSSGFESSFYSKFSRDTLSDEDFDEIKNNLIAEIKSFDLKNNDEINSRFIELIEQKQSENHIEKLIKYLYSLFDSIGVELTVYSEFLRDNLSDGDIEEVKDKIIVEINSFDLKNNDEVYSRFIELIQEKKMDKIQKLNKKLYSLVGEDNLSEIFLAELSDNGLNEVNGAYIKSTVENRIKSYHIKNEIDVNEELNKLFDNEVDRQIKSLTKLNNLIKDDENYLDDLSSQDKEELKTRVEQAIKDNRLDEKQVYLEFEKISEELKKNNENKSSGGFLSKLKKLFSI